MNKVILFDIDYTLFDMKKYREYFFEEIRKALLYENRNEFNHLAMKAYKNAWDKEKLFVINTFLIELAKVIGKEIDVENLEKLSCAENVLKESLFEDAEKVLEELGGKGFKLGIFSRGKEWFQTKKIASIAYFFGSEHIHISIEKAEKIEETISQYKDDNLYLVDDVLWILEKAKSINPNVFTIWIRQGNVERNISEAPNFKPDFTIDTLSQLLNVFS